MTSEPHPVVSVLRAERKHHHRTQADIATAIGTSVAAISMLENGHRWPALHTLDRWAGALGYDLTLTPKKGHQ